MTLLLDGNADESVRYHQAKRSSMPLMRQYRYARLDIPLPYHLHQFDAAENMALLVDHGRASASDAGISAHRRLGVMFRRVISHASILTTNSTGASDYA